MEHHKLFEYSNSIDEGEYISSLNDIEYYLDYSGRNTILPQFLISYNDIRNYWGNSNEELFEKEGESIGYNRLNGNLYYNRLKSQVPSIINSEYKIDMDLIPISFSFPYPKQIVMMLDNMYKLFQTAKKIG